MIGRFQKAQTLLDCKTIPFLLPEIPDLRSPGNKALNKFNDVRRDPPNNSLQTAVAVSLF